MAGSSAGVIGASVGPDYRLAGRVSGGRSGRPRREARWSWSTRGSFAASACPCERGETGERESHRRPTLNIPRTASRAAYFTAYWNVEDFTTLSKVLFSGLAAFGLDAGLSAVSAASFAACSAAAFSAPADIRAARVSLADSRSTTSEYVAQPGEALTAASIAAASAGPISDSGARSRVHATGVGAPRSFITVTIASPIPSERITLPRSSYDEVG